MIMKQTNEELLLQDLCARLPYGVKLWHESYVDLITLHSIDATQFAVEISIDNSNSNTAFWNSIEQVKPYLFPLSSMTEEQKYICPIGVGNLETFIEKESWSYLELNFDSILRFIDWLNKNNFDYRGLIEKGLALDCTKLNIY